MLKVGISGAGYAGRYFVKALGELGYPVVGIANRTRDRGEALAKEAGVRFYESLDDMLAHSGAEVLIVATSTERHLPDIQAAAKAGVRHVFCEKPTGVSVEDTMHIREVCASHSINLGVGYKMRFESIFSKARSLIAAGRIGELVSITLNFWQAIPHSAWYLDSGYVRETMVHTLDLVCWLADSAPERVTCHTENLARGSKEDRASVLLRFGNGVTASLNGGWIRDYPYIAGRKNIRFEIVGTGGYICGIRPDHLLLCDAGGRQQLDVTQNDSVQDELAGYFRRIADGLPAAVSIEDALRVQRILETAAVSDKSGRAEPLRRGDKAGV